MRPLTLQEMAAAMGGRVMGDITSPRVCGVSTDTRSLREDNLFFAIRGGNFDGHDYVEQALKKGATAAVVQSAARYGAALRSAGRLVEVDDTVAALGRLAAWYRRQIPAQVVAVIGSNGKTTTKDLIALLLAAHKPGKSAPASFNNAIGVPLTLLSVEPSCEFVIVELGTNHPGELQALARMARPDLAVVTSIGEEHLEGFGDLDGVAREEFSFLPAMPARNFVAVADQAAPYAPNVATGRGAFVTFGLSETADLRATDLRAEADGQHFRINGRFEYRLPLLGRHNVSNALGAIAIGSRFRLEHSQMAEALTKARPSPMRLQVLRVGPFTIINDAYNANPSSMKAALRTLDEFRAAGRRVVILGDMRELGDAATRCHRELGQEAGQSTAQVIVCIGTWARVVRDGATISGGPSKRIYAYPTVEALSDKIADLLEPGDVVLLKASRGVGLERLMPAIERASADDCAAVA